MDKLAIFFGTIGYMGLRGLLYGAVAGAIFGTVFGFFIGTIYGALWGVLIGLPVGIFGGAIIGLIIILLFHPVRSTRGFRWTLRLLGGVLAFVGTFSSFMLILMPHRSFEQQTDTMFSDSSLFFWLIPALIATICAIFVCDRFALHYLANERFSKAKKKHDAAWTVQLEPIFKNIWDATRYFTGRGILYGAGIGGLYGTFIFPIIGTIWGALFGGILGTGLGMVNGLFTGMMTSRDETHPRMLLIGTGAITFTSGVLGFSLLWGKLDEVGNLFDTYNWAMIGLPALIATMLTVYIQAHSPLYQMRVKPKDRSYLYDAEFQQRLFNQMQRSYDRVTNITSFGFNHRWRRQLLDRMPLQSGQRVADLMAGSGETWTHVLPRIGPDGCITAVDFSSAMIGQAYQRRRQLGTENIQIIEADALDSPIPDSSLDAVICVYGVKTLSPMQQEQFVAEVQRVLKDSGVFGLVEVSVPEWSLLRALYMFHLCYVVPLVGWLLLGNPENYRMLGQYMRRFGDCRELADMFADYDFDVRYESFFRGCATGITGTKRSHDTITA